jgi:hypothetical protein
MLKECSKCGEHKELNEFHKDKRMKSGVRPDCKECKRAQNKKGYEENKPKRKLYKKHQMRRYREDASFRLSTNVSKHIVAALRNKKHGSSWEYLPYNKQQLREHIENQFDDKMTWENYGTYWHVDHIYPKSLLPYDSMEHPNFQKCWALENLRPLEAKANMSKGNKVD